MSPFPIRVGNWLTVLRSGYALRKIVFTVFALTVLAGCVPQETAVVGTIESIITAVAQPTPTAQTIQTTINTDTPSVISTDTPEPTVTEPVMTLTVPEATITVQPSQTAVNMPTVARLPSNGRRVDHTSLVLFDQIPEEYLAAASQLRMVFVDASVGQNINEALDCLTAPSWGRAPAFCRRDYEGLVGGPWKTYSLSELQTGSVPDRIQFDPDPVRYDRTNWEYVAMPALWDTILSGFIQDIIPAWVDRKDVLSYQFNYLHVTPDSLIADPVEGFFVDQPRQGFYSNRERWDISDLEALEAQYPDKVFIYWTTSLSRSIGSDVSTQFNDQMRAYAADNKKFLFDVADILSHDGQDQPCYDNRDGVEYCGPNGCENFPDDGQYYPAICQDYTTETEGGHLGSVSAGKIRLAKGFWVLMAMIAGWQP